MRSDWSPEDLISCWTLDEADWRLLANKSGVTRLGFAVLLKFLELEGRFPADGAELPTAVLDYIAGQEKVDPAELAGYWSGRAVKYHRRLATGAVRAAVHCHDHRAVVGADNRGAGATGSSGRGLGGLDGWAAGGAQARSWEGELEHDPGGDRQA